MLYPTELLAHNFKHCSGNLGQCQENQGIFCRGRHILIGNGRKGERGMHPAKDIDDMIFEGEDPKPSQR